MGKRYTILGWYEGGSLISTVTVIGADNGQQFKNGADLADHYMIDGKLLAKSIEELDMLQGLKWSTKAGMDRSLGSCQS